MKERRGGDRNTILLLFAIRKTPKCDRGAPSPPAATGAGGGGRAGWCGIIGILTPTSQFDRGPSANESGQPRNQRKRESTLEKGTSASPLVPHKLYYTAMIPSFSLRNWKLQKYNLSDGRPSAMNLMMRPNRKKKHNQQDDSTAEVATQDHGIS